MQVGGTSKDGSNGMVLRLAGVLTLGNICRVRFRRDGMVFNSSGRRDRAGPVRMDSLGDTMNNAKFTPGPWTIDWDDNGQWYVNIGGLSVSGNALQGDSGECVESANARLIAAAPDMYLVLTDIRDFLRSHGYDTRLVRAVLDKAEGK